MKKYFLVLSLGLMLLAGSTVFAVPPPPDGGGNPPDTGGGNPGVDANIPNPFKCPGGGDANGGCNLIDFINSLVNNVVFPIGGAIVVLAFIWSGFMFVTAQGDKTKLEEAKRAITYTAIGAAILLGATVIANVVTATIESIRSAS